MDEKRVLGTSFNTWLSWPGQVMEYWDQVLRPIILRFIPNAGIQNAKRCRSAARVRYCCAPPPRDLRAEAIATLGLQIRSSQGLVMVDGLEKILEGPAKNLYTCVD